MPKRRVDPDTCYQRHRSGEPAEAIAETLQCTPATVWYAIAEGKERASAAESLAWLSRPWCQSDWREFVEVGDVD